MNVDICPKCKSDNIDYNSKMNTWYCNDCGIIWYEYNQDLGGTIPYGKSETSPNNNMPHESSADKTSNEDS